MEEVTILQKSDPWDVKWMGRHGHLFLLAVAALVLACCYLPAYCLNGLNSDMVIPAIFYWDVTHGGHAADWYWGGASFLFPDLSAHFLLHGMLGDGVRALEAASALFFLGWVLAVVLGYWGCGLPHVDVFAGAALVLAMAIMRLSLPSFFHSVEHGGAYLVALITVGILQRAWQHGGSRPWSLGVALALILLTAASDSLVLVVLVGPAVATLLWGAWRFPDRRMRGIRLAAVVGMAGIVGALLSRAIFAPELATGRYLQVDRETLLNSLRALRVGFDFRHDPAIAFLSTLDVVTILGAAFYLAGQWRPSGAVTESPTRFFILAYTFFLLTGNWAAAILTGNYAGYETRYLILALVWPVLLVAGWLSAVLPWRPAKARLWVVAVSALCLAVALRPPVPQFYLTQKNIVAPALAALMKQESCPVALGNYWSANILTVLSEGATPVLAFSKHAQASHWFADRRWFEHEPAGGFRLIVMQDEDPEFMRAHFGDPARTAKIGDEDVWVYPPENALHFIPNFGTVGNQQSFPDAATYRVPAPGLYHATGQMEGGEIVARPGRDLYGTVAGGPDVAVDPGRYRAKYTYAFLAAPESGREPVFESDVLVLGKPKVLGTQTLHESGSGPQEAVEEFTISPRERGLLQCHVEYYGSGIIRIAQEEIQRIGD